MIIVGQLPYLSLKTHVVTPHLNCLTEAVQVQMRGHNIMFYVDLTEIIPYCKLLSGGKAIKLCALTRVYEFLERVGSHYALQSSI